MSAGLELLGLVAAGVMTRTLDVGSEDAGFARFLMSALSNDEVVAIALAVRNDPALRERIEICLPSYRFAAFPGIEPDMLTDLAETVLRHLPCDREGRLMALTDESQKQSLSQVVRIDADALLDEKLVTNWIREAGVDPAIGDDADRELQAAFKAVLAIDRAPLRHFSSYVAAVADVLASQPCKRRVGPQPPSAARTTLRPPSRGSPAEPAPTAIAGTSEAADALATGQLFREARPEAAPFHIGDAPREARATS